MGLAPCSNQEVIDMSKKAAILPANQRPGVFLSMLENFLNYIVNVKGNSINTKESYKMTFRILITYIWETLHIDSENITFNILDTTLIENFLDWLEQSRKNTFTTRNVRLAAIRSFSKYAVNHDFEAASQFASMMGKIDMKRGIQAERAYFTTEEVKILIDLPKLNTIAGRRDVTLLTFMFASGARAQEICDLKIRDIYYLDNGRARISLLGKGQKRRNVTIAKEVSALLLKYTKFRNVSDCPDAYVFITQNNPQMSVGCLEEVFKKYVAIAKKEHPDLYAAKSYPPHSMRHTTAISMLAAGVSLPAIKVFLGHEHIATTEIYAKITQPKLEEAIIKWNNKFWNNVSDEIETNNATQTETMPDKPNIIPQFLL